MTETLKDLALAAYKASLEAEHERLEQARLQLLDNQARTLCNLLSEALGVDVTPTGPTIEVDGLTFTVLTDDNGHWEESLRVVGVCPQCGRRTYNTFTNLVELGSILAESPRCQLCIEAESPSSTTATI